MGYRSICRTCGLIAVVALCLCAGGCDAIAGRERSFPPVRGPVIAVLGQTPPRVILLDARDLDVLGTVRLRSQSLGMAVAGERIVTAQCGGPGNSSDMRMGSIRPSSGRVDYLNLGVLDPEEVWASGEGWVIALNGLIDARGMRCERVDLLTGSVDRLAIPEAGQAGAGTRSNVWILRKGVSGNRDIAAEEFYVFDREGTPRVVASDSTRTVDLCGFNDAVVTVGMAGENTRLVRRDARSGRIISERVIEGLTAGPACAWAGGDVLLIADSRDGDADGATSFVCMDPVSLERSRSLPVDGMTAAGPAGQGRMVVCESSGKVVLYRTSDGSVIAYAFIKGRPGELLEAAYLEGVE